MFGKAIGRSNTYRSFKLTRLPPLFLALVLSACATTTLNSPGYFLAPEHEASLAAAPNCCTGYSSMQSRSLSMDVESEFSITTQSPAFNFKQGRSFFAAFEVPSGASTVLLKTFPVNMLLNRFGHVFLPAVTFLGKERQPLGTLQIDLHEMYPRAIGNAWAEGLVPVPAAAKYLVVHDSHDPRSRAWRDSAQPGGYLKVRPGPTGELRIVAR